MDSSTINNPIVIFPASIRIDLGQGWGSTALTKEDSQLGAPGGILRVYAGAHLWRKDPSRTIITCGGLGLDVPDSYDKRRPALSKILKNELVKDGVPSEFILEDSIGDTTYQILLSLQNLFSKNSITQAEFITSEYNIQRISTLVGLLNKDEGALKDTNITYTSAEKILVEHAPKEWDWINHEYEKKYMKSRVELEQRGVRDLRAGTYKYK